MQCRKRLRLLIHYKKRAAGVKSKREALPTHLPQANISYRQSRYIICEAYITRYEVSDIIAAPHAAFVFLSHAAVNDPTMMNSAQITLLMSGISLRKISENTIDHAE